MILQCKTPNFRHLHHLHHVLTSNGQTILQKNVGVVPMQQIDLNSSNRSIQQTIGMMGKNKETGPIQDHRRFSKTLQTKKTTSPMGKLHISKAIRFIRPTHYSIPLSSNAQHRNSNSCLAATIGKSLHSKI